MKYSNGRHGLTAQGKRRWISQWEYKEAFGEFPAYEIPDLRVDKTVCKWCGQKLKNKRQLSFCSKECSSKYNQVVVWQKSIPKVPWCAIVRDRFACTDCGKSGVLINEHGMPIPCNDGLEVHHEVAISDGGTDHIDNLKTKCVDCHKKKHSGKLVTK